MLIVDDEPLARERIRRLLARHADVEVVGLAANGEEAATVIRVASPDLVFLDVQMPGLDGFGVVERVGVEHMPLVVFVTAHDEFALKAFRAHALDYLVKPFDDDRFDATLDRARRMVHQRRAGEIGEQLGALLRTAAAPRTAAPAGDAAGDDPARLDRIAVKTGDRVRLVRAHEIDWIEAEGPYARLHVGSETHVLRTAMHELESRLDPRRFVRIHRSTLVNLDRVKELREYFRGEYLVLLEDGTELKLSRSRRATLEALLGQSF
ncbi:MAG TPA: LytTR family DNA-binding domain-containing protein [Planctomycetota bacterium]|nr:LytTR family DNA-binding domain-containing protein [Planctomycetota bacterium]